MKLSAQSDSLIDELLKEISRKYPADKEELMLTDFHLQPIRESGELVVFDDDDEELERTILPEWSEYDEETFYSLAEKDLRRAIERNNRQKELESLSVWKPYSFVMVDEEKESICDLLLVDDDTLIVSDQLLKGLDDDLDAFLKDLLEN